MDIEEWLDQHPEAKAELDKVVERCYRQLWWQHFRSGAAWVAIYAAVGAIIGAGIAVLIQWATDYVSEENYLFGLAMAVLFSVFGIIAGFKESIRVWRKDKLEIVKELEKRYSATGG